MDGSWKPGASAFSFWAGLAYFPARELAGRPDWPGVLGLAAVVAAYLLAVRAAFAGRLRAAVPLLAVLVTVTFALCAAHGGKWLYLCPLLSIACGVVLRGRVLPVALAAVTIVSMLVTWWRGGGEDAIAAVAWGTFTAGLVTHVTLRLFAVIAELRATRRELANAAVAAERLRFSRDLHDLLGHTLSLMVVKAEAARRLAPRDAEAAAAQSGDIVSVGRRALAEVRAAVAGYRGRGFAEELAAARAALAEAGVRVSVALGGLCPPPAADTLFGWAVREGVTNVIRHADATWCEITLTDREGEIVLEIGNDGAGAPAGHAAGGAGRPAAGTGGRDGEGAGVRNGPGARSAPADGTGYGPGPRPAPADGTGYGLHGLAERAAEAGAGFEAGPRPGGRFTLTVAIPATAAR
ncbi:sensor histidine kinase [Streptosporangium sp. NPDC004379]|uniref:sensor histidine kinase n=1 Tax=Streptosporangium sp. NPDC004379 TaxID=3366189 RepID=UPI00368EB67E